MEIAPVVVFAYNRPVHLQSVLDSLAKNDLASESSLFVYCDGAKEDASDEQRSLVEQTRNIAHLAKGFRSVEVIERDHNFGLADNIIGAVTEVVNKYGRIITLEDDVIASKGFLRYMNEALYLFSEDERVMHISGYMYPHSEKLPETFFFEVPYPGGGWATWKRAWKYFSNDINSLFVYWSTRWHEFNRFGEDYLQRQLEANYNGTMYTWFIKWHAVVLKMDGLTLYPHTSLTNNIGFDSSGSNCGTMTKFDIVQPADYVNVHRIKIKENRKAARIIRHFYSGHWYSKRYRNRWIIKIKSLLQLK